MARFQRGRGRILRSRIPAALSGILLFSVLYWLAAVGTRVEGRAVRVRDIQTVVTLIVILIE